MYNFFRCVNTDALESALIVLLQIVEGPSGDCKWEVHDPINKTFHRYMQNCNEK